MNVEWSGAALADLDRFAQFLQDQFPKSAKVVARELIAQVTILSEHSNLGRPLGKRSDLRQVIVRVLNASYIIQYRLMTDRLVILRVYHGRELRDR